MASYLFKFLKEKCEEQGISMNELSNVSGVPWSTLTRIKHGGAIKNSTCQKLALALKCSQGDIQAALARTDQVLADNDGIVKKQKSEEQVPETLTELTEEEKRLNGVNSMEELMKKQHPEGGLHMYNVICAPKMPDKEILEIVQDTSIPSIVMDAVEKNAHAISEVIKTPAEDEVNHPNHYTQGAVECIDALEASMTPEEFRGYLKGCQMKYMWRYRMKGGLKDLKKARWYLDKLISKVEGLPDE